MNDMYKIGNMLRKIRVLRGYSRKKVSLMLSISTKTIERIENGENAQFNTVLELLKLYKITDEDLVSLFMNDVSEKKDQMLLDEDPILVKRRRMHMLENMSYCGYFLLDCNMRPCFVECIDLNFGEIDEQCSLIGEGIVNGYGYDCRVVVNVDELFFYITLKGKGANRNRIIIVLPIKASCSERYIVGLGYMLTVTSEPSLKVAFQKILLFSSDMKQPRMTTFMDVYAKYLTMHDAWASEKGLLMVNEDIGDEDDEFIM